MSVVAIDFGTTTTVAAVLLDDGSIRFGLADGSPLMPSAVCLTDRGDLAVGRDAERQAQVDPSRFEPHPKRRVDETEILLGAVAVPTVAVLAAVLRRGYDAACRNIDGPPSEVRLTHPARWGSTRRAVLRRAVDSAQLGVPVRLVPEPVAAATHFASQTGTPPGTMLGVYDLGGGTFDAAVLRRTDTSWEVRSEAGIPDLGGVDFDQALLDRLGATVPPAYAAQWRTIVAGTDPGSRRARRALLLDVREGKEMLSRYERAAIPMPEPLGDITVSRADFQALVRERLQRTVDTLDDQLRAAGIVPDSATGAVDPRLAGVYLVGGSSRIPLVTELVRATLRLTPRAIGQPETAVAAGALLVPSGYAETASRAPAAPNRPAEPTGSGGPVGQIAPAGGPRRPTWEPPRAPRPSRPRWLVPAAVGVLVVVLVVVLLAVTGRLPGQQHTFAAGIRSGTATGTGIGSTPSGSSPPSTSPTVTRASTASPPSNPVGDARRLDADFPSPTVRAYLRPSYSDIASCRPYDPKAQSTTCLLDDGTGLIVGSDVTLGRSISDRSGSLAKNASTWEESRWAHGGHSGRLRIGLRSAVTKSPVIYWDRDGTTWCVLASLRSHPKHVTAAGLLDEFRRHFQR